MMRITIGNYSLIKHTIIFFSFRPPFFSYRRKTIDDDFPSNALTCKLATRAVIAFTTKQRVQSSHSISIDNIEFCDLCVFILFRKLLIQGAEVSTFL